MNFKECLKNTNNFLKKSLENTGKVFKKINTKKNKKILTITLASTFCAAPFIIVPTCSALAPSYKNNFTIGEIVFSPIDVNKENVEIIPIADRKTEINIKDMCYADIEIDSNTNSNWFIKLKNWCSDNNKKPFDYIWASKITTTDSYWNIIPHTQGTKIHFVVTNNPGEAIPTTSVEYKITFKDPINGTINVFYFNLKFKK